MEGRWGGTRMGQRARSQDAKNEKRDLLLDAARRLFPQKGYSGTTIEMITAEASLSPGAFYRYFSGKLEIYRTLCAQGAAILRAMMDEARSGARREGPKGGGSEGQLRAMAGAYLSFFKTHRDLYCILEILHLGQGDFFEDLSMVEDLEARALDILNLVASTIAQGVKAGEFGTRRPRRAAAAFWGMMDGVLILEIKGSTGFVGSSLAELWATALDLALEGLKAPRASRRS